MPKTKFVLRQKFSLNDQENFTKKFLVISRSWAAATATSKEIIVKATKPAKTNVKKPSTQCKNCENREFKTILLKNQGAIFIWFF